jgi:hypothetical protein
MGNETIMLLEDRVREALWGEDSTRPLAQAYFRMSMEKKLSRLWNSKQRSVFYHAQLEFIKVLLRMILYGRKENTASQHFRNMMFFSYFISCPRIKRFTKYAVKNIRFTCIPIARFDALKLSESDAFLLRDTPREFLIPVILTYPGNEGIIDKILEFIRDTPYVLDSEWYERYKRRLLYYTMIFHQRQ